MYGYNGENRMVLPTCAPEDPDTIKERVAISVITPIVNIGRWAGYVKTDEDIDLIIKSRDEKWEKIRREWK